MLSPLAAQGTASSSKSSATSGSAASSCGDRFREADARTGGRNQSRGAGKEASRPAGSSDARAAAGGVRLQKHSGSSQRSSAAAGSRKLPNAQERTPSAASTELEIKLRQRMLKCEGREVPEKLWTHSPAPQTPTSPRTSAPACSEFDSITSEGGLAEWKAANDFNSVASDGEFQELEPQGGRGAPSGASHKYATYQLDDPGCDAESEDCDDSIGPAARRRAASQVSEDFDSAASNSSPSGAEFVELETDRDRGARVGNPCGCPSFRLDDPLKDVEAEEGDHSAGVSACTMEASQEDFIGEILSQVPARLAWKINLMLQADEDAQPRGAREVPAAASGQAPASPPEPAPAEPTPSMEGAGGLLLERYQQDATATVTEEKKAEHLRLREGVAALAAEACELAEGLRERRLEVAAERGAVVRAEALHASLSAAELGSSALEEMLQGRELEAQELLQEAGTEAAELRRAQGRIAEDMRSADEYDRQRQEVAQELMEDEWRMEEEHLRLEEELEAMEMNGFRAEARLEAERTLQRELQKREEACKEELDMEICEEMTKAKEEREKYEVASRMMADSELHLGLCTAELTSLRAEQEALSTDLCSELQLRQEASVLCEERLCSTAELRTCQDRMTEELAAEELVSRKAREAEADAAMTCETQSMMEAMLEGRMAGILSNTSASVTELRRRGERLADAHRCGSRLALKVRSLGRRLAELDMYTSLCGDDSNDSGDENSQTANELRMARWAALADGRPAAQIGSTSTLTTKPMIRQLQHEMEQVLWQATAQLKMVEHEQTSWKRMSYRQREVLIRQAPAEAEARVQPAGAEKQLRRSAVAINCGQNHPGASSSSTTVALQERGHLEVAAKELVEYVPPCQVSAQGKAKAQLARWARKAP